MARPSPQVTDLSWGQITIQDHGTFRDAKLWPGGARGWDWNETGTSHAPGVQIGDVEELVDHGARRVILSRGQHRRLQVQDATIAWLEEQSVAVDVLESNAAVERYNELADNGEPVGALIHSTC